MALLLAFFTLVAFVDRASAADVPPLTGYTISSWSGGDGVALGAIRALAQDHDGYLWLGTDSGLYRFDGVHFVSAEAVTVPALPRFPVRALLLDAGGRLWIGFADKGGLYVLDRTRLHRMHLPHDQSVTVNALAEDRGEGRDGDLWVAHDAGLLHRHGQTWTQLTSDAGLPGGPVYHVRIDGETTSVGTSSGLFVRHGVSTRFVHDPAFGRDLVRTSTSDRHGNRWATSSTRGFQTSGPTRVKEPTLAGRGYHLLADRHGTIWLATVGQGLWQLGPGGISGRATVQNGLLSDGIWSLLEDREGNLWVGTHEGLNRLSRHVVTPLVDLGITSSIARGVGNLIWAASSDGLIRFTVDTDNTPARTTFPIAGLRTLHANPYGDVWVASRNGLYRFSDGTFTPVRSGTGAAFSQVTAMTADHDRVVWFADAEQGLWRWVAGHVSPAPDAYVVAGRRIKVMRTDANGTLWMAFESGTLLARTTDDVFTTYGKEDGLPHETILGLWDDAETGFWVAGSHGLSHLEGRRFVTIDRTHGLPARRITGIAGDTTGGLWLGYTNGIARLDHREFTRATREASAQVRLRIINTSEGLAGVPTTLDTNTAARGANGRLWFVTGRGLTLVDPVRAITQPEASGPVRVEGAIVDGTSVSVGQPARLAAGARSVRIDYTALNLTAADRLSFRYQLEGFDPGWQDVGPRRQAFYTNLEPRDYRFRVQVRGEDGGWQDASASWSFSVAPMFYQRPLFYGVCVLAVAGTLGAAWRRRLKQVKRDFSLVLTERARLSRELHDTLLQNMVGIALKVDSIAGVTTVATAQLIDVRRDIEDSIAEARRTIRNMRSGLTPAGPVDLMSALEDAGARATAGSSTRFRIVVAGAPYRCEPGVEQELLRIAQEALANAVRHGHPSQVIITVTFEKGAVALRISDNGRGFEDTAMRLSHFGLQTMRERAEYLGGHFTLTTSRQGTEVLATIPVSSFG